MSDKGSEDKKVVMPNYHPNDKWDDFSFTDPDDDRNLDDDEPEDDEDTQAGYAGDGGDDDLEGDESEVEEGDEADEEHVEDDEEIPEKKAGKKVDKKTAALIEQKRLNKELKDKLAIAEANTAKEAQARMDAMNDDQEIESLVAKGYGEELAKDMVAQRREQASSKKVIAQLQFNNSLLRLEKTCPGIADHSEEIFELVQKTGFTPQQIWKAQFSHESEFDLVTRTKAETTHRLKSGQGQRSGVVGQKANKGQAKLSNEDERAYRILLKSGSKMTRNQFKKHSGY